MGFCEVAKQWVVVARNQVKNTWSPPVNKALFQPDRSPLVRRTKNTYAMYTRLILLFGTSLGMLQVAFSQNVPFFTSYGSAQRIEVQPIATEELDGLRKEVSDREDALERSTEELSRLRKEMTETYANILIAVPNWQLGIVKDSLDTSDYTSQLIERFEEQVQRELILTEQVEQAEQDVQDAKAELKAAGTATPLMDRAQIDAWYKKQMDELNEDYDPKFAVAAALTDVKARRAELLKLREERGASQRALDAQENDHLRALNEKAGTVGLIGIWSGATSRATERFFEPYGRSANRFLQSNTVNLNGAKGQASIYSELYNDYLGPVRVGIGGQLSTSTETTDSTTTEEAAEEEQDALAQRILGGGGTFTSSFGLPVLSYTTGTGTLSTRLVMAPRFSLDLQGVASDSSDVPYHGDLGAEAYLNLTGERGVISLFAMWRPSLMIGNPLFYDGLDRGGYKPVFMNQVRVGLGITNVARISYLFIAGDSFVTDRFRSQISIQILTSALGL